MGEGEQREQGDEEQKKVEKDGKGKTGEEEKEMTGKEVDKDKEIEEGEKMKSSVPEPFHLPACLDKILGETSATVEGQETMEQLLEPLETKSMCVPKAPYEFLPPFSGLRHLSLAKNKISDDEELFAVCLFPALNKLTIYDNPITLRSGKNPHVAISILKDRLGVEVITSASQPVDRPPMAKVFNPKRKIDTHIPKIPKQPLSLETAKKLLGLEHVGTTRQGEVEPDPPVQVDDNGIELSSALYERCRTDSSIPEASSGTPEDQHQNPMEGKPVGGFFLTQVEDAAFNNEDTVTLETKQAAEPLVTTELPEKYRGYEQLLDATTDPHFVEPVGIQQNVRQLERRLQKLQLYPDPFASVVWQGARHIPKQRKLRKLPESMSHRSKADKMEEILKRMKDQKAVTVIPLAHVLRGEGVSRQEDEEAVALLSDLQLKYLELRGRLAAKVSKLSEELGGKEADPKSAGHQPGGVRKGCGTSPPRSSYF
ncbi:X-ray radiation resistance-associated protein 1-like [Narcine bancroftii]|uniref:X-ray radiation resistance-associated protein 1-like n=1 Tax=Narcine bancroftii TaxID=1343680 RepID=UPI0038315FE8